MQAVSSTCLAGAPVRQAPRQQRRQQQRLQQRVACTMAPEAPRLGKKQRPDSTGRFGGMFGGRYVPETLIVALDELTAAYREAQNDPAFKVGGRAATGPLPRAGPQGAPGPLGRFLVAPTATDLSPCSNQPRCEHHLARAAAAAANPAAAARSAVCLLPSQAELDGLLKDYVGRASPLYHADRLSEHFRRCVYAECCGSADGGSKARRQVAGN